MDIALNSDGDLDLSGGDLRIATGSEAVAQYLRQKLRLFKAEWFLDESSGIDYHDEVFVKNPKAPIIDTIFKNEILSAPGVLELMEFSASLAGDTRELLLEFKARSEDGDIIDFSETFQL